MFETSNKCFFLEKVLIYCDLLTILAEKAVREAKFASALISLSATVVGKKRVVARGDRGFRPVVHEPSTTEEICDGRKEISDGVKKLSICRCNDRR